MTMSLRALSGVACAGGYLCVAMSCALAQQAVGYVAMLDGSAQVMRAGELRNLLLGEFIFRGDTVIIRPPSSARIDGRAGSTEICGPSKLEVDCRRLFDGSATIVSVADWWTRSVTMINWFRPPPANLVTRSADPPVVRIGAGRPQKLVAGERSLSIPWLNGRAPYVATLAGTGAPAGQKADSASATFPAVKLAPGRMSFSVQDESGRTARITLDIVRALPSMPDMSASAANTQHKILLEASWLAAHEDGAWVLEAYQRLDTIAGSVPIAGVMQRALAFGDRP